MPEPGSVLCWVYEANCVVCPVLKESGGEVRKQMANHGTEGYSLTGTGYIGIGLWCLFQAGQNGRQGTARSAWRKRLLQEN